MLKINYPYTLLDPERAERIAADMRLDDPEWTYNVKYDPKGTGFCFIEIRDEDGEIAGRV